MTALTADDLRQLTHNMTVFGKDDPTVDRAGSERVHGRPCHLPGGLACRDQDRASAARPESLQRAPDGRIR